MRALVALSLVVTVVLAVAFGCAKSEQTGNQKDAEPGVQNATDALVTEAERDRLLAYCEKMNLTQAQVFKEALELLYKTKP